MITTVAAAALVVIAGALLWRNAPRGTQGPSARGLELSRQATERFDRAERVPLTLAPSEVAERLAAAPLVGNAPDDQGAIRHFHEWLAGFFQARGAGTASAYAAWAKANGLILAVEDDDPEWTAASYRAIFDAEPPENLPLGDLFEPYFDIYLRDGRGDDFPVAIATGADGARIWFAEVKYGDSVPLMPTHLLEDAPAWLGAISRNSRKFWLPRISLSEVIERDGTALVAKALVGTRGRGEVWYTTVVSAFYDPVEEQWMLDRLSHQNTYADLSAPPF